MGLGFFLMLWLLEERCHWSLFSPLGPWFDLGELGFPLSDQQCFLKLLPEGTSRGVELELLHGSFEVFFRTAVKPIRKIIVR